MRSLNHNLILLPFYQGLLARVLSGATFDDSGCCFGQELRYLLHDGIPSTQLCTFDFELGFLDLGYGLFRDRAKLQANSISGDILTSPDDPQVGELAKLQGLADMTFASSFSHGWDWNETVTVVKGLVSTIWPQPGCTIVGRQLGRYEAGRYKMLTSTEINYRHNVESIKRFSEDVGEETGPKWRVQAGTYQGHDLMGKGEYAWSESKMYMVWFPATRP